MIDFLVRRFFLGGFFVAYAVFFVVLDGMVVTAGGFMVGMNFTHSLQVETNPWQSIRQMFPILVVLTLVIAAIPTRWAVSSVRETIAFLTDSHSSPLWLENRLHP